MASFNNISGGSFSNTKGSFSNISGGSFNQQANKSTQKHDGIHLEGSLVGNINNNIKAQGAAITTLLGGIIGYDEAGREAIQNIVNEGIPGVANALLSTYNLTLDDIGNMPLGELAGNMIEGVWQHPVDAFTDFMSIKSLLKPKINTKIEPKDLKLGERINRNQFLAQSAEEVAKENVKLHITGKEFANQIDEITAKYSPDTISKGMQALETLGFRQAPKELRSVMQDLNKANDIYKSFVSQAGAELIDDAEFATRELLSKEFHIPFEETAKLGKNTKLYQDAYSYVKDNDVKPLFHLKPQIYDLASEAKIESNLLERKFGTMDYSKAPENLSKKANEFVDKVVASNVADSAEKINNKIREVNKATGGDMKLLDTGKGAIGLKFLREVNSELKKSMLSTGTYLGANVLTTTLSILNNFNADGLAKTFKNLPKFRLVELHEATTPGLRGLSKLNNIIYRPIASVDRWLENFTTEYVKNIGLNNFKYMQSAIPSKAVITNPFLRVVKELVPFGSYPAAAIQEVSAHLTDKPIKAALYSQTQKIGQDANIRAQELLGIEPDRTQALRQNEKGETITRNTVVTPIQAANMFLFGQQGNAVQIPVYNFINDILSGKGDPNKFTVSNKTYNMDNGVIHTDKGDFNLLPAIIQIGKQMVGPVRFYNEIIVPMSKDRYIKSDTELFNKAIDDAQYANLSNDAKRRVVDNARERIGKRILGTYEYKVYDTNAKVSKSVRRKVQQQQRLRQELKNIR